MYHIRVYLGLGLINTAEEQENSASIALIAYGPTHLTDDKTMHVINQRFHIEFARTLDKGFSALKTHKSYP